MTEKEKGVYYLPGHESRDDPAPFDPTGGGGDDGGMDARIAKLEQIAERTSERLGGIEKDLAVVKTSATHLATKADVADAKASIIMWVVAAIFLAQLFPIIATFLRDVRLIR